MGKKVKVYYDSERDTLDIWLDEPPEEGFSREINEGIIVKYDLEERVVGLEILFLSKQERVVNAIPMEIRREFGKAINEFVNTIKAIT